MKIVLVGVPGTGKDKLAQGLHYKACMIKNPDGIGVIVKDGLTEIEPTSLAVGAQTDYRYELKMAVDRATEISEGPLIDIIYQHSLIDSLAYSATRYKRRIENGLNLDNNDATNSWWLTTSIIGRMFRDSYNADRVLFLSLTDYQKDDLGDEFNKDLDDAYRAIFKEFMIPHYTLYSEDLQLTADYDTILDNLIEEIYGSGANLSDPSEQVAVG